MFGVVQQFEVGSIAEVSVPHRLRRNDCAVNTVVYVLSVRLRGEEEEHLMVFPVELRPWENHRTADLGARIPVTRLRAGRYRSSA